MGFVLDINRQAIQKECTAAQIKIHKTKQLKQVEGMVWVNYIYWINKAGQLFKYDLRQERNYKLLSESIQPIHQFGHGILALATDGTLFYEDDTSDVINKLFHLKTNKWFYMLTPVLKNVDLIRVHEQSLVISLLQ